MADREKVIKGLECCRRGFCFSCPYNDGVDENTECKQKWADDAISLLKAQEPGWISVKDKLPDKQETYLVFRKEPYGMITIAWYSGPENGWLALDGGFYADGVLTHYMPLPEPPKEG